MYLNLQFVGKFYMMVNLYERKVPTTKLPESLLFSNPGQQLIWPGEFVYGYPKQTLDPLIPGEIKNPPESWMKNGSFSVFRRLKQDVPLFWRTMNRLSWSLKFKSSFKLNLGQVDIAARIVGRWPSGAPVSRLSEYDDPELGNDELVNNYFHYGSETNRLLEFDRFPRAKSDPLGITCPMMSHIHKVNTRDISNDTGGTFGSFQNRIIRRGLPYGPTILTGEIKSNTVPIEWWNFKN